MIGKGIVNLKMTKVLIIIQYYNIVNNLYFGVYVNIGLTIRKKTFLIPSLSFIFLIFIIILSFNSFAKFSSNIFQLKSVHQRSFELSKDIEKNLLTAHIYILNSIVIKDINIEDLEQAKKHIDSAIKNIEELSKMSKNFDSDKLNEILTFLRIRIETFYQIGVSIPDEFKEGREYGLDALYGLNDINQMLHKDIDSLIQFALEKFNQSTNSLNSSVSESKNQILTLGAFGVFISFIFAYYLIESINSPILKLKSALINFVIYLENKESNLENIEYKKLKVKSKDEIGELTKSFNKMVSSIEFLYGEQKFYNKKIIDSINYASLIQNSILPHKSIIDANLRDNFIIWKPKDRVGGDIYQFEEFEDGFFIAVIDCTGHGIAGAFMTMVTKASLNSILDDYYKNPAKILKELNKKIKILLNQDRGDTLSDAGLDAGVLFYSKIRKEVIFAGAQISLIYSENGDIKSIRGDRESLGYKKSNLNFEFKNHKLNLDKDSSIYLTTDGLIDQNGGERGFPFGKRKLKNIISKFHKEDFIAQKESILRELNEYRKNQEQNDDITMIGFKL